MRDKIKPLEANSKGFLVEVRISDVTFGFVGNLWSLKEKIVRERNLNI